jgi:hypothetical protein
MISFLHFVYRGTSYSRDDKISEIWATVQFHAKSKFYALLYISDEPLDWIPSRITIRTRRMLVRGCSESAAFSNWLLKNHKLTCASLTNRRDSFYIDSSFGNKSYYSHEYWLFQPYLIVVGQHSNMPETTAQEVNFTKSSYRPGMMSNTQRRKWGKIASKLHHYCQCVLHLSVISVYWLFPHKI